MHVTHSFKCSLLEVAREIDKPQRKREVPMLVAQGKNGLHKIVCIGALVASSHSGFLFLGTSGGDLGEQF